MGGESTTHRSLCNLRFVYTGTMTRFLSALASLQLKRWLPFLTIVVLLHLMLIQWAMAPFATLAALELSKEVLTAELHLKPAPELAKPAPARKAAPKAKPSPARVRKAAPKAKPSPSIVEPEPALPDTAQAPADKIESTPAPAAPAPVATPSVSSADTAAEKQTLSLGVVTHYSINPPPSAELRYNAHALIKGQNIYGGGRIHWQTNGSTFAIKGEFNVLFLSLLNFSSEGTIDPKTGISPTVYAEKRMRKAETNTHFHRERNTISFSASALAYERPGGEQDRASIVWQLVGIGRRDGSKFAPGGILDIAVAGIRNADVWKIRIIGIEEIDSGLGKVRAWHLSRSARKDTYEQSLDVWLSPTQEWYPVKIRHTNTNGDFLDLSLSEINKVPDR